VTEPEPLSVIDQDFDRCRTPIPKNKDQARKRITLKDRSALLSKPVDSATEIDRLDRNQDAHLGGNLKHDSLPPKAIGQRDKVRRFEPLELNSQLAAGTIFQFHQTPATTRGHRRRQFQKRLHGLSAGWLGTDTDGLGCHSLLEPAIVNSQGFGRPVDAELTCGLDRNGPK